MQSTASPLVHKSRCHGAPRFEFWAFSNGACSRAHHADIGGIAPGSMPPNSKLLEEEGAAIVAFKLVRGGVFQARRQLPPPGPQPRGGKGEGEGMTIQMPS